MSFRDGPFNDLKVPLTWTAAVAVIVAIVVGIALLMSDRRETVQTQAYGVGRRMFDVADQPVADVVSAPVRAVRGVGGFIGGYLFAVSENRRLRREVADLRQWRDTAVALEDANARYRAVLGLKTDPPIPMVTGRVVLDSRGPFANTRLANIGVEKGVKVGNPVMNERGLVGRVVGTTQGVSRILLLTDVASRTPVLVDRTDARAILLGDGGANPRLAFLRGQNPVKAGDRIITSGDGGVFPRGLPVGVAAKGLDGQWRVQLSADVSAIDFVRVLEFQDFTALVNERDLERAAMPPLPPGQLVLPAAQPATAGTAAAAAAKSPAATRTSGTPAKPSPGKAGPAKPQIAKAESAKPSPKPASAKPASADAAGKPTAKPGSSDPAPKPEASAKKPEAAKADAAKASKPKPAAAKPAAKPAARPAETAAAPP